MITLCCAKLLSTLTFLLSLNNPAAMASDIRPIDSQPVMRAETLYTIDKSVRPVVVAWNAESPKAFLIALHGFGLHKGAFEKLALAMKGQSISTYALDVRGFGGWSQKEAIDFKSTTEDVDTLIKGIRQNHPAKPIFLLGESMGGALALDYVAKHPGAVDGVISSVPSFDRFSKIKTDISIGASALLTGGQRVSLKTALVNRVSHNEQLKRNWESDPDSRLSVKVTDLVRFTRFMKRTQQSISEISQTPVLLVQGAQDRLMKPQGTAKLFRALPVNDKQIIESKGNEHLIFEDGQFDERLISQVQGWVLAHSDVPILSASIAE